MTGRPREVPVKGIGNTCGRAVARALLDHPAGSARLADLRPRVAEHMQEIAGGDAPDAEAVDRAVLMAACVGTVGLSALVQRRGLPEPGVPEEDRAGWRYNVPAVELSGGGKKVNRPSGPPPPHAQVLPILNTKHIPQRDPLAHHIRCRT